MDCVGEMLMSDQPLVIVAPHGIEFTYLAG